MNARLSLLCNVYETYARVMKFNDRVNSALVSSDRFQHDLYPIHCTLLSRDTDIRVTTLTDKYVHEFFI